MYRRRMGKQFLGISAAVFLGWWALTRDDALALLHIHLGAWLVVVIIPIMVWIASRIHAHYVEVAAHLSMEDYEAVPPFQNTVLVLVPGVHRGLMPALQYARSFGGDIRA